MDAEGRRDREPGAVAVAGVGGAAKEQITSDGAVVSEFKTWLAAKREKKRYLDYDPDAAFTTLEMRLAAGQKFLLREEA